MYTVCVNEARVTQAHGSDAMQIPYNPVDNLDPSDRQRRGGGVWGWTTGYQPYAGHRGLFIPPPPPHGTQVIGTY